MSGDMIAGYSVLTVAFAIASVLWAVRRDDLKKSIWPAFAPLALWLAPVALRCWIAMVLS